MISLNQAPNLPVRRRKLFLCELSRLAVNLDHIHWIIAHLSSFLCLHSHSLGVIVQWKSPIADMFLSRQWSWNKPGTLTRADSHVWLCQPSSKVGLINDAGTERDGQAGHRTRSLARDLYIWIKRKFKRGGTSPETQHNYPTKSEKEQNSIIFPAFGSGDLEELWTWVR